MSNAAATTQGLPRPEVTGFGQAPGRQEAALQARRLALDAWRSPRRTRIALVVVGMLCIRNEVPAQYLTRPQIPWRTITTARFDIHFPAELEEWTRGVAGRMDRYAQAVSEAAGNEPSARVTVIVEDPSNVANGFALPFMEGPVIFLWPTPPSPSPTFGAHRGWGEALAVHEYAHIAHLTFPTRNPRERFLWNLLPVRISPVARKAPAWVIEGYATLIEGRMTANGRPFSVGRAAVLRQWALEGKFPTYAQLNGTGAFLGGNMRYLVGSAFLEWLQDRRGDSSLVHLWRRMSARQQRSFDASFASVFGAAPGDLYGAFTVEVMERALQVRSRLRDAGLVEGELVQRRSGGTGEPALSPDGTQVAVVLRSPGGPSRLVVWDAAPAPDTATLRARERLLALDSLDVPPFDSFPAPRRARRTLPPVNGRSHEWPRWMPDGVQVLVTRDEVVDHGATRPDLFLWNTGSGGVRRVTRGAGIRQADPSPDGREAVATRCHAGICSLVLVDLATGRWRVLAPGTPDVVWHRPRFSPDGSQVAASLHEGGAWGVAIVDVRSGAVRRLAVAEGASRYAPSWVSSGRELVVVSERGGIANLEIVPVDSGPARTITRVTGAVLGPDVNRADGSVWFLALRSGGYDVRRLPSVDASLGVVAIHGGLAPVAPPTMVTPVLDSTRFTIHDARLSDSGPRFPIPDSRFPSVEYGLGPRRWRVLPGFTYGADGATGTLMVGNIDPIARLSVVAQAGTGTPGTWQGASIAAALRRAPELGVSLWSVRYEPSRQPGSLAPSYLDMERYVGAGVVVRHSVTSSAASHQVALGATAGRLDGPPFVDGDRLAAVGEWRGRISRSSGTTALHVLGSASASLGTTDGYPWRRAVGSLGVVSAVGRWQVRGDWLRGDGRSRREGWPLPAAEQFIVGGSPAPYIEPLWMSHRIALPAVPAGFARGAEVDLLRASVSLGAWEGYATWVSAGRAPGDFLRRAGFRRLLGVERRFSVSPLGFVSLPGLTSRVGAAWSPDTPFAHQLRAYASLAYSP